MSRPAPDPQVADIPQAAIDRHYEQAAAVYRTLGTLDGDLYCPATADFRKWYATKPNAPDGYAGRARPFALGADYQQIRDVIDRVLYATVNYASRDAYADAWEPYNYADGGGYTWASGDSPTPDYRDLRAYAPFADIDLDDAMKTQRPDGDIPQAAIEDALAAYIDAFADLAGDRDAVFALDSVGGAYVIVAPTAVAPIAREFSGRDRARILEELASRLNDWLADVADEIAEQHPAAADVFEPDCVNHRNRAYKAPLSLHKSLDGVVTPVDTDAPSYDYTAFTAVDDSLRESARQWADDFTSDYPDAVESIVAMLFTDELADEGSWQDALASWLADARRAEQDTAAARATAGPTAGAPTDSVGNMEDAYRALDRLDARDVAEQTIVASWNESAVSGKGKGFYPVWGPNSNGTANYVTEDVWHDTGADAYGTVIEMALINAGELVPGNAEPVSGRDWLLGYAELMKLGYDLPLLHTGCDDDMSEYYAYHLEGVAADHDLPTDAVHDDPAVMLEVCLLLRDEYDTGLEDETPPYKALVGVAQHADLMMADAEANRLGCDTHRLARNVFDSIDASDV